MGRIEKDDYTLIHGRGVGNALSEALNTAEDKIWVVSPWISPKYAQQLKDKYQEEDVDVKLLTSNQYNSSHKKGLRKLLKKEKISESLGSQQQSLALLAAGGLLAFLGVGGQQAALLALGLILGFTGFILGQSKSKVKYKKFIPFEVFEGDFHTNQSLTHSKVYILDERVFVGSSNLTESGLWQNIEVLFKFEDQELKDAAHSIFDNIENSVETDTVDMTEVGKKVYEEIEED